MSEHISHIEYVANVKSRIGEIARAMIGGELSFLEGARKLVDLRHAAGISDEDVDFMVFVVIESDTDDLPLGEIRNFWLQSALSNLNTEIDDAESWARKIGFSACESLAKRFDSGIG